MSNAKIARNVRANIIGISVQIVIAFMLAPFLVHTLGDTKYGIWTIAIAFTGYMNLLDLGLTSAVNKYVSQYNGVRDNRSINAIVSTSLALFLLMGLIIVLLSPFMANFIVSFISLDESLVSIVHMLIIIVSFDIAIFVVSGLFKGIFGGYQHYSIINIVQIISALFKALMFYAFLSHGHDLIAMGYISIAGNVLSALLFYWLLKKYYPQVSFTIAAVNKDRASEILHYSKFTFLAMFANQIIYYSDAFVIGFFMTAAAVTHYSIPWTLAEYTKKILFAISNTYAPAISEKDAAGDLDNIKHLYLSGTRYMIIISNLLSVGMIVLGGAFIALWMGSRFQVLGETVLIILFINLFFQGPQTISYAILQGLAKQKYYSYMSMVVSIANLALSILLVQKYGIVGVALGAAIPQILFYAFFVPWLTLKTLNIPRWYYFRQTFLPSLIPTAVLFLTLYNWADFHTPGSYFELLGMAFVCTLVYLLLVFFMMLNDVEKKASLALLKKVKLIFTNNRDAL